MGSYEFTNMQPGLYLISNGDLDMLEKMYVCQVMERGGDQQLKAAIEFFVTATGTSRSEVVVNRLGEPLGI